MAGYEPGAWMAGYETIKVESGASWSMVSYPAIHYGVVWGMNGWV